MPGPVESLIASWNKGARGSSTSVERLTQRQLAEFHEALMHCTNVICCREAPEYSSFG